MSQSKKGSMIEAVIGSVIAFTISMLAQAVIYPLYGVYFTFLENFSLTMIFTVISIIRSYFVRRMFNWFQTRAVKQSPRTSGPYKGLWRASR